MDVERISHRILAGVLILAFLVSDVSVYAQGVIQLPAPGNRLALSPAFAGDLAEGHAQLSPSPLWGGNGRGDDVAKNILREVIIPALEKEVNEGQNFATLRQVYNSLILATWYKRKVKASLLGQVYVDKKKTGGIDIKDKNEKEKIWAQYVEAFRKGAYNLIREEYDPATQARIPRKYFSGGTNFNMDKAEAFKIAGNGMVPLIDISQHNILRTHLLLEGVDGAMTTTVAGINVPRGQLSIKKFSWKRAFGYHAFFNRWIDENVFHVPLTVTDHLVLVIGACLGGSVFSLNGDSVSRYAFWLVGAFFAYKLSVAHMRQFRDGYFVFRNAVKYNKNASTSQADVRLMGLVNKFENATGWKVLWTDDPYLLAWPNKENKNVVMSIGWVINSNLSSDTRRLAYLQDILRTVRHATIDGKVESSTEKEKSEKHDKAMDLKGGIDLNPSKIDMTTKNSGAPIDLNLDPAMFRRMQDSSGVTPVIVGIHALGSLQQFLEIPQ